MVDLKGWQACFLLWVLVEWFRGWLKMKEGRKDGYLFLGIKRIANSFLTWMVQWVDGRLREWLSEWLVCFIYIRFGWLAKLFGWQNECKNQWNFSWLACKIWMAEWIIYFILGWLDDLLSAGWLFTLLIASFTGWLATLSENWVKIIGDMLGNPISLL